MRGNVHFEHVEGGQHKSGDAIRVIAGAPTTDRGRRGPDCFRSGTPVRQGRQRPGQVWQTKLARSALAGGLGGQIADHLDRLAKRARLFADGQDDAGAQRAAHLGETGP